MEFHPVASIFPLLEGVELDQLVDDIRENGLYEPIWVYDDQIIDGRNRFRACQVAGVEPRFKAWNGEGSLVQFVLSLNLHRRHLNKSQLSVVALEVLPWLEKEAKERQRQAGREHGNHPTPLVTNSVQAAHAPRSIAQAAALTGASSTYVGQAKQLAKEAPDLLAQVSAGEIGVDTAARRMKARRGEGVNAPKMRAAIKIKPSITEQVVTEYGSALGDVVDAIAGLSAVVGDCPEWQQFSEVWAAFRGNQERLISRALRVQEDWDARLTMDRQNARSRRAG